MNKGLVVVAMVVMVSVMAEFSRMHTTAPSSLDPHAQYEQQIEEGFGHLDQLPNH